MRFALTSYGARRAFLTALASLLVVLFGSPARLAWADRPPAMSSRTIALPSGPSSMGGLGESFSPNLSTGAGNFSIPIELPPGLTRPTLSLQYTNGHGRSELGSSFNLPRLQVYRTKDKGNPAFAETDRFAVAGPQFNDELVLVNDANGYYRLKNEGPFALFVRDRARDAWIVRFPDGGQAELGTDESSRQYSDRGVYKWFVRSQTDSSQQRVEYQYFTDKGYVYLKSIRYQLQAAGYENHVDFGYEYRNDSFTDYSYGSAITCRQRLNRIDAYAGCGLGCQRDIRTYVLTYAVGTQSLLSSVQLFGEGGADALPPMRFTYNEPSRALGRVVTMPQSLPLDLVDSGRAQIDDVNGDGLPDLLVGTALGYSYYENRTGAAWSSANSLSRSPDVSLDDASNGVILADINGDGFRDVLRATTNGYSYFPGGNIAGGKLVSFLPAVPVGSNAGGVLWNDPTVRLADLNFDGRTDMLRLNGARALKDLNIRDFGTERVKEIDAGPLPGDVARHFDSPTLLMLDVNGDGAQDFVLNEISWGESRLRVFYGLGEGRYADAKAITAPKGNPADFLFGDINNDGYIDLVRYSGQSLTYWLGAGDERFNGPFGGTVGGAPGRYDVRSVHLIDMDGSGTADLVLLTNANRVVYVSFFANPYLNLLSKIDNGMGGVTTIAYRTSTEFAVDAKESGQPWKTTLPRPIPVVAQTTSTDSLDKVGLPPTVKVTTYEYADGFYEGKEREFRGFGFVRVTDVGDEHVESRVTETWMHLGIDPETGADQEILKGKTYRQVVRNAAGEIYASEESRWEPRWLCAEDDPALAELLPQCTLYPNKTDSKDSLVAFAVRPWSLKGAWEKTTTPRFTLDVFDYDLWGHVLKRTNHGEVAFPVPHALGDAVNPAAVTEIGGDELVESTSYLNDPTLWLLGVELRTEKRDATTGTLLAATETYYDGNAYIGLPLGQATRGKVTRQRAWLKEENRFIDRVRIARDSFDLVTDTLDANGNHASVAYDDDTHSLPVREVADTGEGGHIVFAARYDTAQGKLLESSDPDGNVSRYQYDGLGRLKVSIDPDSTEDLPTSTYDYEFGTADNPVSALIERHLVDRAKRSYRTTYHYIDGAGRTRLRKGTNDRGDAYVASGWVTTSATGAKVFEYKDFASGTLGIELPPTSTPFSETYYDALQRPVRVYPTATGPNRTYSLTQRLPLEERTFDEEDTSEDGDPASGTKFNYPAVKRLDGLGRLRETIKYNDYRVSTGTDRARRELRWTYTYDPLGKVTSWTDPQGNRRDYTYDSLSRLTDILDKNQGAVHHAYDDAGNQTLRVDALGQERHSDYGPANRVLKVRVTHDAHGNPDYEYVYHYDTAHADGPLPAAANLSGRIAWVEWPTGSAHVSYDRLGRIVVETESLWDPSRSPFEAQIRDTYRRERDFDAIGLPTEVRLPGDVALTSTFNARGFVSTLGMRSGGVAKPLIAGVDYDTQGHAVRTTAANGTAGCAWFNARAEIVGIASGASRIACDADPTKAIAGAFQQLTYDRSPSRAITRVADLSVDGNLPRLDAEYGYDRLHELTFARTARGIDNYEYDALQNVVRHTSTVPGMRAVLGDLSYGENGAGPNALTSAAGVGYEYDAAGQLKSYNGFALEFDGEGRLTVERKEGGPTVRHYYDAAGARRITITTRPDETPKVHRYVFEEYQIRDGEQVWSTGAGRIGTDIHKTAAGVQSVRYTYKDHLTGTTHVADESGILAGFQQFGPYGDLQSRIGSAPLHGFAGSLVEPVEDAGLVRFGARYYAPAIGRWTSPDRYIGAAPEKSLEKPLESNLYSYGTNDPINRYDPSGSEVEAYNVEPGPPGKMPFHFFMGLAAHTIIATQYKYGVAIDHSQFVYTNVFSIVSIITRSMVGDASLVDAAKLLLKPDIADTFARKVGEIKRDGDYGRTQGKVQLAGYLTALNASLPPSDPRKYTPIQGFSGELNIVFFGGKYAWKLTWHTEDGVILYDWKRSSKPLPQSRLAFYFGGAKAVQDSWQPANDNDLQEEGERVMKEALDYQQKIGKLHGAFEATMAMQEIVGAAAAAALAGAISGAGAPSGAPVPAPVTAPPPIFIPMPAF